MLLRRLPLRMRRCGCLRPCCSGRRRCRGSGVLRRWGQLADDVHRLGHHRTPKRDTTGTHARPPLWKQGRPARGRGAFRLELCPGLPLPSPLAQEQHRQHDEARDGHCRDHEFNDHHDAHLLNSPAVRGFVLLQCVRCRSSLHPCTSVLPAPVATAGSGGRSGHALAPAPGRSPGHAGGAAVPSASRPHRTMRPPSRRHTHGRSRPRPSP